jgi:hypothetical protein
LSLAADWSGAIKVCFQPKKDIVEEGLRLIIQRSKQQAIRELRVKLKREGDLLTLLSPKIND